MSGEVEKPAKQDRDVARRSLKGRKLGDRRLRIERPHSEFFRYSGHGQLTAKATASAPETPLGRAWARAKTVLIGRPLASEEESSERLSKTKALAVFSSDAISSSTYASEEILLILVAAGTGALAFSLPVAVSIALLLLIVSTSYRQICRAYPSGAAPMPSPGATSAAGRAPRRRGPAVRLRHDGRGLDRGRRCGDHVGGA